MSDLSNCIFLDGLKIKNFRIFKEETDIIFSKKISLIIGENGLGKTSVLDAIDMFCNNDEHCNELNEYDFSNHNMDMDENLECHFHFQGSEDWLEKRYKIYGGKINFKVFQPPFINAGHTFGSDKMENEAYTKKIPKVIYFGKDRLAKFKNCFKFPGILQFREPDFYFADMLSLLERIDKDPIIALKKLHNDREQSIDEDTRIAIKKLHNDRKQFKKLNCLYDKEQLLKSIDKNIGIIEFVFFPGFELNNDCFVKEEESREDVRLVKKEGDTDIPLSKSGSGFELIIALLLLIEIETERNKDEKILLLIDEPELSLHPEYQRKLIDKLSKLQNTQIILTSHSPTFVKHCMDDKNCEVLICKKEKPRCKKCENMEEPCDNCKNKEDILMTKEIKEYIKDKKWNFLANHTNSQAVANFLAFGEYSTDLHNLLYGLLDERDDKSFIDGDLIWYKQITKGEYEKKFKSYEKIQKDDKFYIKENKKSIHYIIRNLIHHPENTNEDNLKYKDPPEKFKKYLEQSINEMIGLLDSSQGCQTQNQEQKEQDTEAQVERFMQGKI